jgi:hypothetical protein
MDPFLRYTAATSLFQEVRILQRYVRDALIGPNQRGYVVRVQVTLMPAQRNQPIDAYTTLSFFGARAVSGATPRTAEAVDPTKQPRYRWADITADAGSANARVVPLLVSDNIEGAMESVSTAVLRRFSLGLLGMLSNVGVSGDASRAVERLQTLVGRELNSLMTVGQLSDNSIRVRFGAMNQPSSELGLVPRNQTVTLLVITPDSRDPSPRGIRIASKTDFVNGRTGTVLPPQSRKALQQRIDLALKNYNFSVDESDARVADMVTAVQEANPDAFRHALQDLHLENVPADQAADERARLQALSETIWMDVAAILSALPYTVTTAALPPIWTAQLPEQRPLAIDDGKVMTLAILGGGSLRGSDVYASVRVGGPQGGGLPASSVIHDARGHITLVFPSPSGTGLCPAPNPKASDPAPACTPEAVDFCRVLQRWESIGTSGGGPGHAAWNNAGGAQCWPLPIAYRSALPPKIASPHFSISSGSKAVVARADGSGVVNVRVVKKDDAPDDAILILSLDGADIAAIGAYDDKGTAVKLLRKGAGFAVPQSLSATLELRNLDPSVPIAVVGSGADAPGRIDLRVVRAPSKE